MDIVPVVTRISSSIEGFNARLIARIGDIAKAVVSRANRPVVKMSILIRKAAAKAIASLSKGFMLRIPTGTALIVSCVKCGARGVGMNDRRTFTVGVRDSGRILSRMIMIKCNIMGGHSLAKSISSMGTKSVRGATSDGTVRTVRTGIPNLSVRRDDNRTNSNVGVGLHNGHSVGTSGSPLVLISNIRCNSAVSVGPSSVRSVRILGSTSSATVCNAGKTGNMVVVSAGENGTKGAGMGLGTCISIGRPAGVPGIVCNRHRMQHLLSTGGCGSSVTSND